MTDRYKFFNHRSNSLLLIPLLLALLLAGPLFAQEQGGYRLLFNQVRVDAPEHWRAWDAPTGVQVVREDGTVEPRFLRSGIEVAQDASDFIYVNPFVSQDTLRGGISEVGSNRDEAPLILDRNPNTYWEPLRGTPVDQWFVEIDLGRAVIARRVVLRFAEEGQGDPLLKFREMICGVEVGHQGLSV